MHDRSSLYSGEDEFSTQSANALSDRTRPTTKEVDDSSLYVLHSRESAGESDTRNSAALALLELALAGATRCQRTKRPDRTRGTRTNTMGAVGKKYSRKPNPVQSLATMSLSSLPRLTDAPLPTATSTSEETARQTDEFLTKVDKELYQWVVDFCGEKEASRESGFPPGPSSYGRSSIRDRVTRITTILKAAARTSAAAYGDQSHTGELGPCEALALAERVARRQRLRPEDAMYHDVFDKIETYISAINPFRRASTGGAEQHLRETIEQLGVKARVRRLNLE